MMKRYSWNMCHPGVLKFTSAGRLKFASSKTIIQDDINYTLTDKDKQKIKKVFEELSAYKINTETNDD